MDKLGNAIRKTRKRQGITLSWMAGKIRKDTGTLSRYETGEIDIPCHAVVEIARVLGVPDIAKQRMRECQVWCYLREMERAA